MTWTVSKREALAAFMKYYRDHRDGYTARSIGTFAAQFHEIISSRTFIEPSEETTE